MTNEDYKKKNSSASNSWDIFTSAFNSLKKEINWRSNRKRSNFALRNLNKSWGTIGSKSNAVISGGITWTETGDWKEGTATGLSGFFADKALGNIFTAKALGGHLKAGGANAALVSFGASALYEAFYNIPKHRNDPTWAPTGMFEMSPAFHLENFIVKKDKKAFLNHMQLREQLRYQNNTRQHAAYQAKASKYGQQILSKTKQFGSYAKSTAVSAGKGIYKGLSWLGNILKSAKFFHSGGVVPGRGDVLSVLKGGETVRTEAQERALQEELLRRRYYQQEASKEKNSKESLLPRLSKEDEQYVIGLVADAYKRNRYGFRTVLRS